MQVGIRELKAHLSEYLDRAAQGETIEVTNRGDPYALLGPVPMARRMRQAVSEGWLSRGDGSPPSAKRRRFRASRPLEQVIDEDRGD